MKIRFKLNHLFFLSFKNYGINTNKTFFLTFVIEVSIKIWHLLWKTIINVKNNTTLLFIIGDALNNFHFILFFYILWKK